MNNNENFTPHNWGQNINNNLSNGNEAELDNFPLEMFEPKEVGAKSTDINDMFGEILGRVEHDAQMPELSNSASEMKMDITADVNEPDESEDIEAAYTQGFMDGVNKQRNDTDKEMLKAAKTAKDIEKLVAGMKVELDAEFDAALKHFLIEAAKSVLGGMIDDNTAEIIKQKLSEFVIENGFIDYKITLNLNPLDYSVFEKMNDIDISISKSNTLAKGQARLVATGKNGTFHAEFDAHSVIERQVEELI